jgi:hypothetical protein
MTAYADTSPRRQEIEKKFGITYQMDTSGGSWIFTMSISGEYAKELLFPIICITVPKDATDKEVGDLMASSLGEASLLYYQAKKVFDDNHKAKPSPAPTPSNEI